MKHFPVLRGVIGALGHPQIYRVAAGLAIMTAAAGLVLPLACLAQDLPSTGANANLVFPAALTNLTPLSDRSIAVITGMGLKGPPINGNAGSTPPIILWDELRPTVQRPLTNTSFSTVTVNGIMQ